MISFQIKNKGIHEVLKFENMAQMILFEEKKWKWKKGILLKIGVSFYRQKSFEGAENRIVKMPVWFLFG